VENKDNEFVGLEKTLNLTFMVTRLGNFSPIGLLLKAHYALKGWSNWWNKESRILEDKKLDK
jgi:hypothetical protein